MLSDNMDIIWVAGDGDLEKLKSMAEEHTYDINIKANHGWSAILMAIYYGHMDVVRYLVEECNADINGCTSEGNGPLHLACQQDRPEIFIYLAEETKADVCQINGFGNNTLHLGALYGQHDIVKYLIEKRKVDMSIRNHNGVTALQCAFAEAQLKVMRYLMVQTTSASAPDIVRNFQLLQRFVSVSRAQDASLSLGNILLVSVQNFLEFGRIPKFEQCLQFGIHVSGNCLKPSTTLLFVSHRWRNSEEPDVNLLTFKIIKKYIQDAPLQFDYVWIDYSCLMQENRNSTYECQLHHISTVILAATHVLAVPAYSSEGVTNLADFLSRGWVQMELIISMVSGCTITCVFDPGDDKVRFFELISHEHNVHLNFKSASEQMCRNCKFKSPSVAPDIDAVWGATGLGLKEPSELLKDFVDITTACKQNHPEVFEHIHSQKFSEEDFSFLFRQTANLFLSDKVLESYNGIGEFSVPSDRILALRILFFTVSVTMYDMEEAAELDSQQLVFPELATSPIYGETQNPIVLNKSKPAIMNGEKEQKFEEVQTGSGGPPENIPVTRKEPTVSSFQSIGLGNELSSNIPTQATVATADSKCRCSLM